MGDTTEEAFKRPGWNQGAIWMGADAAALLRILAKNRFRVRPAYWLDCAIDLSFSVGNSFLRGCQAVLWGRKIRRLPAVEPPTFILGHWRTGTTMLHEMLNLDPRHCAPTTFQCFVPGHFLLSERMLKWWSGFVLPKQRPQDRMRMGWDLPQEDEFALCNLGIPSPYATIAFPNHPLMYPRYVDLEGLDPSELQRWKVGLRRFVRSVQHRNRGRVVLKSPYHTFRIPTLNEMFPRARYVHLTRHPHDVFPSTVHLWKALYSIHGYQKPRFDGLHDFVFEMFSRMHDRFEQTRTLIEPRLVELQYEDLVRDPINELRRLYDRLDLGSFDEVQPAVQEYLAARADHQKNRYALPAELADEVYRRWRPYFEKYRYAPRDERSPAPATTPTSGRGD